MIFEIGQHVKCLLKNGALAEGIILEWTDNCVKLKSLDDESLLIIHHPQEDIMLTKIILEQQQISETINTEPPQQEEVLIEVAPDQSEVETNPFDHKYNKSIAELKKDIADQERKIIADKLKNHRIGEVTKVNYGYPGFFKKPRTK